MQIDVEKNLKYEIKSELARIFSKAKYIVLEDGKSACKYVYNEHIKQFYTEDGLAMDEDEFIRRIMDVIQVKGLIHVNEFIRVYDTIPAKLKGFATVVYGRKLAKEIKKNPVKTGKKMKKAFRKMI